MTEWDKVLAPAGLSAQQVEDAQSQWVNAKGRTIKPKKGRILAGVAPTHPAVKPKDGYIDAWQWRPKVGENVRSWERRLKKEARDRQLAEQQQKMVSGSTWRKPHGTLPDSIVRPPAPTSECRVAGMDRYCDGAEMDYDDHNVDECGSFVEVDYFEDLLDIAMQR